MRTPELLREFLRVARTASGAARASLLLQMEPADRRSIVLLHDGSTAALPELADEDSAWQLLLQASAQPVGEDGISLFPSAEQDAVLVRLSLSHILSRTVTHRHGGTERRARPTVATAPPLDGALWLGLGGAAHADDFQRLRDVAQARHADALAGVDWLDGPLRLAARLAWCVYQMSGSLQDPVSGLPGRMEFQVFLRRALTAATDNAHSVGLLLVNPDDFGTINHRYGRAVGDRAVRQLADQLLSSVRSTDAVFRYGGAVFGVVLPGTDLEQARAAADKLRQGLTRFAYLDGAAHMTFSVGGVVARPEDVARGVDVDELLRRADMALNLAKLGGGARLLLGTVHDDLHAPGVLDPISGIFTADSEKDFRNMLLLWDTVSVVSANQTPAAIARAFVDRLATAFHPQRIALFDFPEGGGHHLLAAGVRDALVPDGHRPTTVFELDDGAKALLAQVLETRQAARLREVATPQGHANAASSTTYAMPLLAREQPIGCLYLEGSAKRGELDSSDMMFLNALATQLAIALDRAALAARWQEAQVSERKRLEGELRELRQALSQAKLVFRSAAMHAAVDSLRRVASSSATVLIVGESGTGKEMLARTLHELSDRRDGPFVTVDCGAIAESLIEAELFGHVKGAFTGADRASEGRIAQSAGGTLFLDEIGEMPLELQARLLRFVQEKEFTPVGAARARTVDTRIVAATNRRLELEVAQGRFRADLYYRLQVIVVEAPPLRTRKDDILPLAHYFLEKFVAQNGTGPRHLTVAAEQLLTQHGWPGNVRELQHCMLRAVLMSPGESIDAGDIRLAAETVPEQGATFSTPAPAPAPTATATHHEPAIAPPLPTTPQGGAWAQLQAELERQVAAALAQRRHRPVPIGRWLTEDFVLAASRACGDVSRRAARRTGVPESTFRRQLDKAVADRDAGLGGRAPQWQAMHAHIGSIVAALAEDGEEDVLERARMLLLGIVSAAALANLGNGAALMGVTLPTYKRWLQEAQA